jgi:hypothetical protein
MEHEPDHNVLNDPKINLLHRKTTYPNSLAMLEARDMERGLATSYSMTPTNLLQDNIPKFDGNA